MLGAPVHGSLSLRWQTRLVRGDHDESDHDARADLNLLVGDDRTDKWSGALLARADWDVGPRDDEGSSFRSLADTFDSELSFLVHEGWVQHRTESGKVAWWKAGRQYVDVAESFHVDGVSAQTGALTDDTTDLRVRGYAGVPVHFYERGSSGDWLAGAQVTANPAKGTRAALDLAHVQDDLAGYSKERNDLAALSLWRKVGEHGELNGRFTYLDGPSDARLGGTFSFPEQDLLFMGSYKRLLEDRDVLSIQFDPYYEALRTYREYHVGDVRAVKGLSETVRVEAGVSAREVVHDSDEGPFNRNTRRVWVTPSFDDLLWKDSTLSAGVDSWSGDGERIRTWTADLTHRFGKGTWLSVGSDFTLYDYGRLEQGERSHVRTVYARARIRLTDVWSLDVRGSWEHAEEETFHVVSAAITLRF